MGDGTAANKASIPEWQKNFAQHLKAASDAEVNASGDPPAATTTAELLDQAKEFLEDASIRGAPRERKIEFLQKKGLPSDDIQKLLGPDAEPSSTHDKDEESEIKTVHDSTGTAGTETSVPALAAAVPSAPGRDLPPIITYPEFLLKPQRPPPLVTFQRLAYAAYTMAGVSALAYGASKFLVEPMLESLSAARHELAQSTLDELDTLNTKLEARVSCVPAPGAWRHKISRGATDTDDVESVTSDPTELFHRDMATQTSPPRSRSPSVSTTNLARPDPTTTQVDRLNAIKSSLSTLESLTDPDESSAFKDTLKTFQDTIDKIQNNNSAFAYQPSYPAIYPVADKSKKGNTGEVDRFKQEVRALKGAFLGARNFPVARPVGGAGLK